MGRVRFKGGASGKEYAWVEESAGELKAKNVSDDIDLLRADSTTITDASGIKLKDHDVSRAGGSGGKYNSEVSQFADSGDKSCTIGTGGTNERTTVLSLPDNWYNIIPKAVYIEVGGTVASGETISVSVKVVMDNNDEYEITSYSVDSATGSKTVNSEEIYTNLLTNVRSAGKSIDGRRITSVVADVNTNQSSTDATVKVRAIGVRT